MAEVVRELLRDAGAALADASLADAWLEATILLAHVLARPRAWLLAHPEAKLTQEQTGRLAALVARRVAGEPVAYLTGVREFWSLPLRVTRHTLIPRPETELVTERAFTVVSASEARVADLGTGSGAIAASLAQERTRWHIIATDASQAALEVARDNFARLGLRNVETRVGNWYEALPRESFDLIASNPPYIRANDPHLERGDPRHEPRMALASGQDGLDALRRIIGNAPRHLADSGWLIVEHGWDQGETVRALFQAAGFDMIRTHRDLAGHERVTEGCLTPA